MVNAKDLRMLVKNAQKIFAERAEDWAKGYLPHLEACMMSHAKNGKTHFIIDEPRPDPDLLPYKVEALSKLLDGFSVGETGFNNAIKVSWEEVPF